MHTSVYSPCLEAECLCLRALVDGACCLGRLLGTHQIRHQMRLPAFHRRQHRQAQSANTEIGCQYLWAGMVVSGFSLCACAHACTDYCIVLSVKLKSLTCFSDDRCIQ